MKRYDRILILTVLLVALLIAALWQTPKAETVFSCHTYDSQGRILKGHWSEPEGTWYLFVTAVQDVAQLQLHCTGEIAQTSAGTLAENTVTGGFQTSGDALTLTLADGTTQRIAVLQSSLPSVYINLERTTLDAVHADKDTKLPGNSVYIMDPSGNHNLSVLGTAEIKGRGNSTWTLADKRGYQLDFEYETSVLGMEKARKWILLANAFDDTMMRSQLVYTMAEKMDMAFVPNFEYVDLWISGEYLGTYLLGEKVEIDASRLDLRRPDGALFEHDEGFYMEEEYWLESKILHRHFTLKDIKEARMSTVSSAMAGFEAAVDRFALYLYTTPSGQVTLETLSQMIDVDSFAKYYLINEYALNRESFVSSFYWYLDGPGDALHLGPVWDFDSCMGNDGCDYTQHYGDNHLLFSYLLSVPEFYARTVALFEQYKPEFEALTENAQVIKERIETSAYMNDLRWNLLGKPSGKFPELILSNSFDEAVAGLQTWLEGRKTHFTIPPERSINTYVSEDCRTMTLCLYDCTQYSTMNFAVWCSDAQERQVIWYPGHCINGVWQATVDLSAFNMAGFYITTAYSDGVAEAVAGGGAHVPQAAE